MHPRFAKTDGFEMRRFGEPRDLTVAYTRRPGAYAILIRDGQILLTFQQSPEPEFQLPGGGIDAGETAIPALHREVYEETGWKISTPLKIGTYKRFCYMPEYDMHAEKICSIYIARPTQRMGPPTEEGHFAFWLPLAEAPALLANSGDRFFLERVLGSL